MTAYAIKNLDLSHNSEEAFIAFEKTQKEILEKAKIGDHNRQYGVYVGAYSYERDYVIAVLAFLDEYDLDIDVTDIRELNDDDFSSNFNRFLSQVSYAIMRFSLRIKRIETGAAGTPIMLAANYKDEIGKNLEIIKKIVNQEVKDENKKDVIFKKIAALQSEIDRDRTTLDAAFGRLIDLSKVVGECAENLEPIVQKIERITSALRDGSERVKLLPKKERPKLISAPKSSPKADELEDEIPF